jgi:hypothetical protein
MVCLKKDVFLSIFESKYVNGYCVHSHYNITSNLKKKEKCITYKFWNSLTVFTMELSEQSILQTKQKGVSHIFHGNISDCKTGF